jgi:gentisate 1,2-dioxygenase
LVKASQASDGSPYDGIIMQYVNPATGGPVMKTLGACIQLLRAGERTRAHRHTGSIVYNVAKGEGFSIIAGRRFDWRKNDIFVVPSWAWHEHANASDREDAVLFSFNDLPSMQALGLYREEGYGENAGRQQVAH